MKLQPQMPVIAIVLGALVAMALPGYAAEEEVTYYEHVAPILQANCQSCHRTQGEGKNIGSLVAPMPLLTYQEARPWARAIAAKVKSREMPPWFAAAPVGVFKKERILTEQEIETIVAWAASGAPAGDKSKEPAPLVFPDTEGWTLGEPDLIVSLPEPYFVPDDGEDVNATFYTKLTEEVLPHDAMVRAWEFKSGTYIQGKDTVHHMGGGISPPSFDRDSIFVEELEAEEVEVMSSASLGFTAGGTEPDQLPEGYGVLLEKGSTVGFSIHYYKEKGPGTGFWNNAQIGFYFAKGPIKHVVRSRIIGNQEFEIPPYAENHRIGAAWTTTKDTVLLALWPHSHLRGKAFKYVATYPDGTEEVLIDMPVYDQTWQLSYRYREPKLLPKGTRIDVSGWFENTEARGATRQFDPSMTVHGGPRTQDEMLSGLISYAELEPGETYLTTQEP